MQFTKKVFEEYSTKFNMPMAQLVHDRQDWYNRWPMQIIMPLEHDPVSEGYLALLFIRRESNLIYLNEGLTFEPKEVLKSGLTGRNHWCVAFAHVKKMEHNSYPNQIYATSVTDVVLKHPEYKELEDGTHLNPYTLDDLHDAVTAYIKRKTKEKKNQKKWEIRSEAAPDFTDQIKESVAKHDCEPNIYRTVDKKVGPWPYRYHINFHIQQNELKERKPWSRLGFTIECARKLDKFSVYGRNYDLSNVDPLSSREEYKTNDKTFTYVASFHFDGDVGKFPTLQEALEAIDRIMEHYEMVYDSRMKLEKWCEEHRIETSSSDKS